ncbi:serine/threonine protein kinase [Paenibacillus sp. GYB004]|uniref:serine/threonine protein kinase n=1 Tax=Paenibacillus sp. GYB004 TaxID=2994393 RepID=UPI002F967032
MEDFRAIKVETIIVKGKKELKVHNPTDYPMIGIGAQGAVFRLSPKRCVKLYESTHSAYWEAKALKAAKEGTFFPRLHEAGDNYVVMDYLEGPTLQEYVKRHGELPEWACAQIVGILQEMRRFKFARIDTRIGHIIVTSGNKLKVIDHSGAFRTTRRAPFMLLISLEKAEVLLPFLRYAARHHPKLYEKWRAKRREGTDVDRVPRLPRMESLLKEETP